MSRKPTYSDDRKKRVISVHGGRWVAQHFSGGAGQKRTKGKDAQPHIDPWQDIAPATLDKSAALARIVDNQQARV
jgi:hypothetical protein